MSIVGAIAVPHPPLIIADVGRGSERSIQATIDAYEYATEWLLTQNPECLVVASPHAPLFSDAFHVSTDSVLSGSMAQFNAPQEQLCAECDSQLAAEIIEQATASGIQVIGASYSNGNMDHATYVPLYFVRKAAGGSLPCPIVRIGLSGLSFETHRRLGNAIAKAAALLNRRVGFIASGDLSHKLLADGSYGFAPEGPMFDERIGEIFSSGDLDALFSFNESFCDAAAECGLRSFQIMAGALEDTLAKTELLSYEGPFGVGYCVAKCMVQSEVAFNHAEQSLQEDNCTNKSYANNHSTVDPYIALARLSVETFVKTGRVSALPCNLPSELRENRAGVFVSLHMHGELRGCIGTIEATCSSIAQEIIQNGISACSRDPRFNPVQPDELDYLEYSVDVLSAAEPIDSSDELNPKRYGVIVSQGWKRGLLLPNLDGINSVSEQLRIAKLKAGISPKDTYVSLERFEVIRHSIGGEPRR